MTLRLLPGSFVNGIKIDPTKTYVISKTKDPPKKTPFTDFLCVEKVYNEYWTWSPYTGIRYEDAPKVIQASVRFILKKYHKKFAGAVSEGNLRGYIIFMRPEYKLVDLNMADILMVPSDDYTPIAISDEKFKTYPDYYVFLNKIQSKEPKIPENKYVTEFYRKSPNLKSLIPLPTDLAGIVEGYGVRDFIKRNIPCEQRNIEDQEKYEKEERMMNKDRSGEDYEGGYDSGIEEDRKQEGPYRWLIRYPEHLREYLLNNDIDLKFLDGFLFDMLEAGSSYDSDESQNAIFESLINILGLFPEKWEDYLAGMVQRTHDYEAWHGVDVLYTLLEDLRVEYPGSPFKDMSPHGWDAESGYEDRTNFQLELVQRLIKLGYIPDAEDAAALLDIIGERFLDYYSNEAEYPTFFDPDFFVESFRHYMRTFTQINTNLLEKLRDRIYFDYDRVWEEILNRHNTSDIHVSDYSIRPLVKLQEPSREMLNDIYDRYPHLYQLVSQIIPRDRIPKDRLSPRGGRLVSPVRSVRIMPPMTSAMVSPIKSPRRASPAMSPRGASPAMPPRGASPMRSLRISPRRSS